MNILYRLKGPARIARSRHVLREAAALQLTLPVEGRRLKGNALDWSSAASLQYVKSQLGVLRCYSRVVGLGRFLCCL